VNATRAGRVAVRAFPDNVLNADERERKTRTPDGGWQIPFLQVSQKVLPGNIFFSLKIGHAFKNGFLFFSDTQFKNLIFQKVSVEKICLLLRKVINRWESELQ